MQTNLERTIPATLLRRFEKPHVVIFPNVQQKQLNLMEKIVEFFHPKSPPSGMNLWLIAICQAVVIVLD